MSLVNPWIRAIDVRNKYKKVIIDDEGKVINENPTKEDLRDLPKYISTTREITKLPEEKCKRYLVEFIRHWNRKNRSTPKIEDFDKRYPSSKTYQKVFKSWNNAIKEAGLVPNHAGRQTGIYTYTDEELLEYQIKWYEEYGEPPTARDFMHNLKYPNFSTYDRLRGWQLSLKILGLDIDSEEDFA